MDVKQADRLLNLTHQDAKALEHFLAVFVSAKKDSSVATASAPLKILVLNQDWMLLSAVLITKPTLSAAHVETVSGKLDFLPSCSCLTPFFLAAANVIAIFVRTPKKSSAGSSASAITSHVIDTTQFSARDLIMVSVSVASVNVTMVGEEMLANAAARLTHVKLLMAIFVLDTASVDAVNASVRSKKTSDILEDTAKNVQHVQAVVMS